MFERFVERPAEEALADTPVIEAIAVTDYYVTDTYEEVLRDKAAGRLPSAKLVFPKMHPPPDESGLMMHHHNPGLKRRRPSGSWRRRRRLADPRD